MNTPIIKETQIIKKQTKNTVHFGYDLKLAKDNKTLAILNYYSSEESLSTKLNIYTKTNKRWSNLQEITIANYDVASDFLSVDISDNGEILVVCGNLGDKTSIAHIYKRINKEYSLIQIIKDLPYYSINDNSSAAISGDGSTLIISNYFSSDGLKRGIYIYKLINNEYTYHSGILCIDPSIGSYGGYPIISHTGDIIITNGEVVINDKKTSCVFVYKNEEDKYVLKQTITHRSHTVNWMFGKALTITKDTKTIAISAPHDNINKRGIYIYSIKDDKYQLEKELIINCLDIISFSNKMLSFSSSGNDLVVGLDYSEGNTKYSGSVHHYKKIDNKWILSSKLIASDGCDHDEFGYVVDINGIGNEIVVGAYSVISNKKLEIVNTDDEVGRVYTYLLK